MGESQDKKSDKVEQSETNNLNAENLNKFREKIKPSNLDIVSESDANEV